MEIILHVIFIPLIVFGTRFAQIPAIVSTTPCLNGGACTGGAGTFTCACVAGYAGSTCETSKLYILTDYIPIYIHYLGIKKQNKMKFLLVAHQEIINKEHTKRKKALSHSRGKSSVQY